LDKTLLSEGKKYCFCHMKIDTSRIIDMSLIMDLLINSTCIYNNILVPINEVNINILSKDYIDNRKKNLTLALFSHGWYLYYKSNNLLHVAIQDWVAHSILFNQLYMNNEDLIDKFISNF